jgi:hypothetical protein
VGHGLSWLVTHPETTAELIADEPGVVWRKVGRREPSKFVRKARSAATATTPGRQLSWLDTVFPPRLVDRECRPFELGWLLYAWQPDALFASTEADMTAELSHMS